LSGLVKIVPRENTVWLLTLKMVMFVRRVLQERQRPVPPHQVAQIVLQANFKRRLNQLSGLVKLVPRENTLC
jgi:hypothetical protein